MAKPKPLGVDIKGCSCVITHTPLSDRVKLKIILGYQWWVPEFLTTNKFILTFWGWNLGCFVLAMYNPINETLVKTWFSKNKCHKNFKIESKSPFMKKFWYEIHSYEEQANDK